MTHRLNTRQTPMTVTTIDQKAVTEIFADCRDPDPGEIASMVHVPSQGTNMRFSEAKLSKHREKIQAAVDLLPKIFHSSGGALAVNACQLDSGVIWTSQTTNAEKLLVLATAAGMVTQEVHGGIGHYKVKE